VAAPKVSAAAPLKNARLFMASSQWLPSACAFFAMTLEALSP